MLQRFEPVTICDQFLFFCFRELKPKLLRETFNISFYGLIEDFCFNIIDRCQVTIHHHLNTTNGKNHGLNLLHRHNAVFLCWFIPHISAPPDSARLQYLLIGYWGQIYRGRTSLAIRHRRVNGYDST